MPGPVLRNNSAANDRKAVEPNDAREVRVKIPLEFNRDP